MKVLKLYNYKKNSRGFTVMEAMVVVVLITILAALAIPAVSSLMNSLKMTELDAYARQIFLISQNQITEMKASGEWDDFKADIEDVNSGAVEVLVKPADYEDGDESWDQLYGVSANMFSGAIKSMLVGTTVGNGSHAYIEINPQDGSIYSVFYAESAFTYDDELPRERTQRQRYTTKLGYYCGSNVTLLPDVEEEWQISPTIEVINGEELAVIVKPNAPEGSIIYVSIEVTGEVSKDTMLWTQTDTSGTVDEMYLILDSIMPDKNRFAEVTKNSGLIPGENLSITVKVSGQTLQGKVIAEKVEVRKDINSLFSARDAGGNITVSHVRHLNNLRASIYSDASMYTKEGGVTISQAGNISFDFNTWKEGKDYVTLEAGPDTFDSIDNTNLMYNSTYNGGGNIIADFIIEEAGETNTGLFKTLENSKVQKVRLENFRVVGGDNVGTLAGMIKNTTLYDCRAYMTYHAEPSMEAWRAARNVKGNNCVGGLVGRVEGGQITLSCGAVDVTGSRFVGGLAGYVKDAPVHHVYGSGNVKATTSCAGGVVGYGEGLQLGLSDPKIYSVYSTSEVSAPNYTGGILGDCDANTTIADVTFLGTIDASASEATQSQICGNHAVNTNGDEIYYLRQKLHVKEEQVGTAKNFYDIKQGINGEGTTVPYALKLQGNYFPFPLIKMEEGETSMTHYGDWPEEFSLTSVSVVYYEKYQDGSYGYYAEAYLVMENDTENPYSKWVTDSLCDLRDDSCVVEDGYAILSVTPLEEYKYTFYRDALDENTSETGEPKIVFKEEDAKRENSLLMASDVSIRFYEPGTDAYFTANQACVYRLPFDVQIVDRITSNSFWAKLVLTCVDEAGKTIADEQTHYFCPDFAKNAINPDPESEESKSKVPDDPYGSENVVYVRSPRQLNGLARSTFYWTRKGENNNTPIYFRQEVDLDYYNYTKKYCGVEYDLMNTSAENKYRNCPIGRPAVTGKSSNFQNYYDGMNNLILDYCCEVYEDYQFAGLFGELNQGGVYNVVMKPSGNMEEGKKPYIRVNGGTRTYIGAGAIAGLLYVNNVGQYDDETQYSFIENCAVSGYEISFKESTSSQYKPASVGGIAGYSFGRIENCTAVSCSIYSDGLWTNNQTYERYNGDRYMGGIAGSINLMASITSCYAGMNDFKTEDSAESVQIGGIAGGIRGLYFGGNFNILNRTQITNCYSFWQEGDTPKYPIIKPVVKNYAMNTEVSPPQYDIGTLTEWTDTRYTNLTDCYYLADETVEQKELSGTEALTYEEILLKAVDKADATYPYSKALAGYDYPFQAVVSVGKDGHVHYGDWPESIPELVYYEETIINDVTSWKYYSIDSDGNISNNLDNDNEGTINSYGYAIKSAQSQVVINGQETTLEEAPEGAPVAFYPLTQVQTAKFEAASGLKKITLQARLGQPEQTYYVNTKYAAAIFSEADKDKGGTTEDTAFQIRTPQQLEKVGEYTGAAPYFVQTHNIDAESVSKDTAALITGTFTGIYDGNNEAGNTISGLRAALFENNQGTLKEITLKEVNINAFKTAPVAVASLAVTNKGIVTQCAAAGIIQTLNYAAGLVYENRGRVEQSYANCIVKAQYAAGFVWKQTLAGTISNCYAGSSYHQSQAVGAQGTITGSIMAAGFIGDNSGAVSNVYTLANVSSTQATQAFGFGPAAGTGTVTEAYWIREGELNQSLSGGEGQPKSALEMRSILKGASWTAEPKSYPDAAKLTGKSYPYPALGLDHYGDWPVSEGYEGKIGVAREYRRNLGGYNSYSYSASGEAISRDPDASGETFTQSNNNYWAQEKVLIFFEKEKVAPGEWTVEYRRRYGGGPGGYDWSDWDPVDLGSYNKYEQNISTSGSYNIYYFNSDSWKTIQVRLANATTNEQYIFQGSTTFTLQSSQNTN